MIALPRVMNRRAFLRAAGAAGLGSLIAERILASPYRPLVSEIAPRRPLRIRGVVRSGGQALNQVVVSDGVSVVRTARDGSFELLSDSSRPFAFLSVPAGYQIPTGANGTAAMFAPLRPGQGEDQAVAWDLVPLDGSDEQHAFLLLADPQTLDMEDVGRFHAETVPDIQETVAELGEVPLFGVGCGDLMFDRLELFPQYEEAVRRMGIPFFQVLGNHDVEILAKTDQTSARTFQQHFGPTYYSFNRGAVHYIVMDDVFWFGDGYLGYLDEVQLTWLRADLASIEHGRLVVLFMHIPSYNTQHERQNAARPSPNLIVANREALNQLLEPYDAHIIVGHMHELEHLPDGRVQVHVCGAVCGAWWTGEICTDGTPNGYGIFTVGGEELSWQYKSTHLPLAHQMRVYARGTDPTAPDEIVANVWDWDPAWEVVWIEDGIRKGRMARRRGKDPLSVALHSGPQRPAKHPWVEPIPTDHLFYAPVAEGAQDILVEATDGRGRTVTARPEPVLGPLPEL